MSLRLGGADPRIRSTRNREKASVMGDNLGSVSNGSARRFPAAFALGDLETFETSDSLLANRAISSRLSATCRQSDAEWWAARLANSFRSNCLLLILG